VAKPEKDASVFAHVEALVAEEHRLFEHGELSDEQKNRLGEVQIELDRFATHPRAIQTSRPD
jgi:Protein of unknown function (DUF2630)